VAITELLLVLHAHKDMVRHGAMEIVDGVEAVMESAMQKTCLVQ